MLCAGDTTLDRGQEACENAADDHHARGDVEGRHGSLAAGGGPRRGAVASDVKSRSLPTGGPGARTPVVRPAIRQDCGACDRRQHQVEQPVAGRNEPVNRIHIILPRHWWSQPELSLRTAPLSRFAGAGWLIYDQSLRPRQLTRDRKRFSAIGALTWIKVGESAATACAGAFAAAACRIGRSNGAVRWTGCSSRGGGADRMEKPAPAAPHLGLASFTAENQLRCSAASTGSFRNLRMHRQDVADRRWMRIRQADTADSRSVCGVLSRPVRRAGSRARPRASTTRSERPTSRRCRSCGRRRSPRRVVRPWRLQAAVAIEPSLHDRRVAAEATRGRQDLGRLVEG